MALGPDDIIPAVMPYVSIIFDTIWMVLQLVLILVGIAYAVFMFKYDTKIEIRDQSKGYRTIGKSTRARRYTDKKTGTPMLQLFHPIIFRGERINEPPSECLIPCKSRLTPKMYSFVRKDGLFYPINNYILGVEHRVVNEETGQNNTIYSIEGSGLEVNRDYNAEQAIQNTLIEKATTYRNKKPTEIIASYALMIITIIASGVVMWYAWKQFGNVAYAIASLKEPLESGILQAAQNIIGPG